MEIKQIVLEFLKECDRKCEDGKLFGNEGLDSIGCLELLEFLEERIGIDLDLSEYEPEEFSSLDGFCEIVRNIKEAK